MNDTPTPRDDDRPLPGGDYLWDRTGPPDPQVAHLERALAPLRYRDAAPRAPRTRRRWLPRLAAAAAVAITATVAWLILQPATPTPGWAVLTWAGANGAPATSALSVGEWLETDAKAVATMEVADIGTVTVHPNSRVKLVRSEQGLEHRLRLDHGRLNAFIVAPPRLFFVDTPAAVAVDLGCEYTLEVDESGTGELAVTLGWVALETSEGTTSTIPRDGVCRMRGGVGPGTPFFDDAPEPLRDALEALDFDGGGNAALTTIVDHARARDTLTLWHLLSRVDDDGRRVVLDRMVTLAAMPAGVTTEGILRLNARMLDAWRDELERTW